MYKFEVLKKYYESTARGDESLSEPSREYFAEREEGNNSRISYIERKLPEVFARNAPKVMDIGCAAGMLLDRFKARGFETYGVEPTYGFARYARERSGHNVLQGFFDKDTFAGERFDLIVLSHVMEHIYDPHELLSVVVSRLKVDGFLYVEVPNCRNIVNGTSIEGLFNGPHVQMFSTDSLSRLTLPYFKQLISCEENRDCGCTGSVRVILTAPKKQPSSVLCSGGKREFLRNQALVRYVSFRNKFVRPVRQIVGKFKRKITSVARSDHGV